MSERTLTYCTLPKEIHCCHGNPRSYGRYFDLRYRVYTYSRKTSTYIYIYVEVYIYIYITNSKQTPWPLVRERTIPTERPPLDEIIYIYNIPFKYILKGSYDVYNTHNHWADGFCPSSTINFPLIEVSSF
jgi:hypothetical protein